MSSTMADTKSVRDAETDRAWTPRAPSTELVSTAQLSVVRML
ncbi:MAG: hypothetical protein ABWY58_07650 [Aeromicrobium sp.]